MSAIANKLAAYRRGSSSHNSPASPASPAPTALTPPLNTPAVISPIGTEEQEAPSTLHARVEELLGQVADKHVPAWAFGYLRQVAGMLPMLRAVGLKIPALPANLPDSPAALKLAIRRELYARPAAELASLLTLAEAAVSGWLAEYEASQNPGNAPAIAPEEPHGRSDDEPTAE